MRLFFSLTWAIMIYWLTLFKSKQRKRVLHKIRACNLRKLSNPSHESMRSRKPKTLFSKSRDKIRKYFEMKFVSMTHKFGNSDQNMETRRWPTVALTFPNFYWKSSRFFVPVITIWSSCVAYHSTSHPYIFPWHLPHYFFIINLQFRTRSGG